MKTYEEAIRLGSLEERFEYLKLGGQVGYETFGCFRYINQRFYQSVEWRRFRNEIITRDKGCELALNGNEIYGRIIIHHINPLDRNTIAELGNDLFDYNNVICVSEKMHRALHYGTLESIPKNIQERMENDTCPWRKSK